ncbi:alkane 1-monooxygenase [Litorivita sp. NS0012-18]|uniref:alkane 1-monooxygenase n=1 Tax=Litorivita sp. NS0012-18 TaxID=3127655 RepID=UPI00310964F7
MLGFSLITLAPVLLLALSAVYGGPVIWAALAYMSVFAFLCDRLSVGAARAADPGAEFPAGKGLSAVLGLAHLPLLALALWAVAGPSGLDLLHRIGAFAAFGLFFGQISHPNAHELIHRAARWPRVLGKWVYCSLLIGHHASAHPKVHHVWAASERDPASAPLGMGFYRYFPTAFIGSFTAGLRAENEMRARKSTPARALGHPYVFYIAASALVVGLSALAFGAAGVLALIGLGFYAQLQLFLSDYVQHYGLRRGRLPNGKLEPVGPQHSWNAPQWFTSAMMLNAPRHSDHHLNPQRPYPGLRLDANTMPILPYSLPVMVLMALWPARFRALMDPLAAPWQPHWEGQSRTGAAAASDFSQAGAQGAKSGGTAAQDGRKLSHDVPVFDRRDTPS